MPVRTILAAGIEVDVWESSATHLSELPVAVLFILHGRFNSRKGVEKIAERMISLQSEPTRDHQWTKELVVVTFDHRNHGSRLVDRQANCGWNLADSSRHNDRHALDMYSIQSGTASDVSLLIDFLPSYLYPSNERPISLWAISGFSLGGHSTWIALKNDSRLTVGVPIVGCPDYLQLMTDRATQYGYSVPDSHHFPSSLVELVQKIDPAATQYTAPDGSNPFIHKKILVIAGGRDTLVPWKFTKPFFDSLHVGSRGSKESFVDEDAGHEWTARMADRMAAFITASCLL